MNAERRKQIAKLSSQLDGVIRQIEEIQSEEQDAYDNLPDSFQSGEQGDASQEAIQTLESAIATLNDAQSELENIQ
jgi:hypothetical protein